MGDRLRILEGAIGRPTTRVEFALPPTDGRSSRSDELASVCAGAAGRMDTLRMLFVSDAYPPADDGVARNVAQLVQALRARGHDVHVLRTRQSTQDVARRGETLVRSHSPFCRAVRLDFPLRWRLRHLMERLAPDVVHIATEGPFGWAALEAAKQCGLPVSSDFRMKVVSSHATSSKSAEVAGDLRIFHNRADGTTVPSERLARELLDSGLDRLAVIGRGVDADLYSPRRRSATLRGVWLEGRAGPIVIHVGSLVSENNIDLLLRAVAAIRGIAPEARLVVVGDGPLRCEVERWEPGALVLGWRSEAALATCYASGDMLLLPGLAETFGDNVTLEAMASGLPIVAFDHAAAGEFVHAGISGSLAPHGDDAAFIACACRTAADPILRARWGTAARATALVHSWSKVGEQFEVFVRNAVIEPNR